MTSLPYLFNFSKKHICLRNSASTFACAQSSGGSDIFEEEIQCNFSGDMQVCNCSSFFAQISSGRIFGRSLQCDALASFPSYYVPIESIRGSSIHVYKCVPRSSIHVYSGMRRPYARLVGPFCLPAGYQFCTHTPMCVILYIYIGIIVDSICLPSTRPLPPGLNGMEYS